MGRGYDRTQNTKLKWKDQEKNKQEEVIYLLCSKIVSQHRQQTAITDAKANTICSQNLQENKLPLLFLFQMKEFEF